MELLLQNMWPGNEVRNRYCADPRPAFGGAQCSGLHTETQSCNLVECPINGVWSTWSDWVGVCMAPCGTEEERGHKYRNRSCSAPQPQYGGIDCPLWDLVEQIFQCPGEDICPPIHGMWSVWSTWAGQQCMATCGTEVERGQTHRNRTCSAPEPQYGGNDCPQEADQSMPCPGEDICFPGSKILFMSSSKSTNFVDPE